MEKEELKNVRGSIDYGGKEAKIRSFISRTLQEVFEKYGYTPLETSILCYYDLLALKYDEDNDILKEIYKVSDQGNRNLALRYDLTVPFAKYIATNKSIKMPYKRYEIGKVFRDGPIKKGRTREFIQCDVDSVGIEGQMIEAELISIYVEGFQRLGIDIVIKYNNRKLMNGIIEACNIEGDKISQVITIIDKMDKLSSEEIKQEFYKISLEDKEIEDIIQYLKMNFNELKETFANNSNKNLQEGIKEVEELNKYIDELNLNKYVEFSPALARGQEYYTGTIFEAYTADASLSSSLGGGGRYDNMIGDFINDGKKYPAVGISFGLDVIFEILKEKQICLNETDVYIIPMENNTLSLKIASELRKQGIKVDIEMNSIKLKKALGFVDEQNIPLVIILGEEEVKNNKIIIKDMRNSFQILENINGFEETVMQLLSIGMLDYNVLNPGGNKTGLISGNEYTASQKKLINRLIMEKNSEVEQVGFLSKKINRLEMAGGEFCLNATRCAIWKYLNGNEGEITLSVSGVNKEITGKVLKDKRVQATLDIGKNISELYEERKDFTCIKIDGILIAVLDEEKSKQYIERLRENEEEAKEELKQLMINELDTKEKAVGIMLLEKVSDKIKINPIVWVKEIDTVFYETACGSGSLGTSIYNYIKTNNTEVELVQPSGYSINVKLIENDNYIDKAIVTGVVEE